MAQLKGRILCTEDDPDTREMLSVALQHCGYDVVCPTDSKEALSLSLNERFDLILLDNWMPELSGIDFTRELRRANISTPILFCSGAASPTDIQEALDLGAQGYLVKPLDFDALLTEIERLITRRAE
jgi:DNA-binding response OmpR family regulator